MSWDSYVENLMADKTCRDAAIVGYTMGKDNSVWASQKDGIFAGITLDEIDVIIGKDRKTFFKKGLVLGDIKRCSVLRDGLYSEDNYTMDLKTKSKDKKKSEGGQTKCQEEEEEEEEDEEGEKKPKYNIAIAKANKALVFVMGKEGIHGGALNKKAYDMAKYLMDCGY